MADVAGAFLAVTSLTIQLADQINKLYAFWDAYKDAPQNIRDIVHDLKFLSSVLDRIQQEEWWHGPDSTTTQVLEACSDQVEACMGIVRGLSHGLESQASRIRKRSAMKTVFQSEKIKRFHDLLQSLKSTLLLAQSTRIP